MIKVDKNIAQFEGTAKGLTFELTHLLLGFKQNLIKEFGVTEEEALNVIHKCGEIAFMSNEEREEYLSNLLEERN